MSRSIFGWSLPPGVSRLPGEEPIPPCCEDCPEKMYENCPGEDNCSEFKLEMKPACCLKHRVEFPAVEWCYECEKDDWRDITRCTEGCDCLSCVV